MHAARDTDGSTRRYGSLPVALAELFGGATVKTNPNNELVAPVAICSRLNQLTASIIGNAGNSALTYPHMFAELRFV